MVRMKKYSEKIMHVVFLLAACASILAVILICAFLFVNGIPTIGKIGLGNFALGKIWRGCRIMRQSFLQKRIRAGLRKARLLV